ncbi:MAG: class IV adenylate cyclase [Terriglobales bacterium]
MALETMALETEVKLSIHGATALRRALRAAGFRPGRRRQESNWLFDDANGRLRRQALLLRLRRSGRAWTLTAKGRPQGDRRLKIRREAEVALADGDAARALLAVLGFRPRLAYERERTLWRSPAWPGLAAAWDRTIAGDFLELEGPARQIRGAARKLGFAPADFIIASYPDLFRAWARRAGHRGATFSLPAQRGNALPASRPSQPR